MLVHEGRAEVARLDRPARALGGGHGNPLTTARATWEHGHMDFAFDDKTTELRDRLLEFMD